MVDPRFLLTLPGTPRRTLTRVAGALARVPLPRWARAPVWGWLARRIRLDAAEMEGGWRDYPRFVDLFARRLPHGARPLADEDCLRSPTDGLLVDVARVRAEGSWVIKGTPYATRELLSAGDHEDAEGGRAAQLYLGPGDVHRFHAPCALRVESAVTEPGGLQPVDPATTRRSMRLLARNRRVLLRCRTQAGERLHLLFLGALGVGGMRFSFDPTLGRRPWTRGERRYDPQPRLRAGEDFGCFELGSAVLVFVPARWRCAAEIGQRCRARAALFVPADVAEVAEAVDP